MKILNTWGNILTGGLGGGRGEITGEENLSGEKKSLKWEGQQKGVLRTKNVTVLQFKH